MLLLLLWLLPSAVMTQNLYGPSQLDQYARLINSGNLGGFGLFQNALAQGTVRGLGDLSSLPLLPGLPPLPLTHEEVMRQLTSTLAPMTTRATAAPTTPPTNPGGIYAINTMVEMPPMPENRIHGTFDDDGVFHPDHKAQSDENQIVRNQIQGTKIRDFSQAERDTVEGHAEESSSKDEEYEDDESYEDPALRATSNAAAHRLAQHNEKVRKTRQNPPHQRQILNSRQVKYLDSSATTRQQVFRSQPVQEERYPPFVFRPRPPPPQREPEYNNLLAEIEEYDDFLDQQREYLSRFPKATLQNPYRDLPPGQLPAAGSYSSPANGRDLNIPPPRRIEFNENWRQLPQQQSPPQQSSQHQPPPLPPPQLQQQQQQQQQVPWLQMSHQPNAEYPAAATDNPLLNIFKLLSIPHAHAFAAPQVRIDDPPTTTTAAAETPHPRPNPYQLGMLPVPANTIPLVDIQQQPLSFPQLGSPLVLTPLFSHGK